MFRFSQRALLWVVVLFGVEVFIALRVHDRYLRPYGGDVLAVIFVYALLRTCLPLAPRRLALGSFGIGAAIELGQYFQLATWLGAARYPVIAVVFGTTFQWGDFAAYALGAVTAWSIDTRTSLMRCK